MLTGIRRNAARCSSREFELVASSQLPLFGKADIARLTRQRTSKNFDLFHQTLKSNEICYSPNLVSAKTRLVQIQFPFDQASALTRR